MFQQESIAQRLSKDFGVGLLLYPSHVKINDIQEALVTVLNDPDYLRRSIKYSKLSRDNNGTTKAANILSDYINAIQENDSVYC